MKGLQLTAAAGIVGVLVFAVRCRTKNKKIQDDKVFAAVEAGGTTFVVALARGHPTNIIDTAEFSTTTPDETLGKAVKWLEEKCSSGIDLGSIGIASFGPVDLNRDSSTYGFITSTPKPSWAQTPVVSRFAHFNVPIAFDTDVNGAALSELAYGGHAAGTNSCCYVTVGTGVGVGVAVDGRAVHGFQHPEGGHVMCPAHPVDADRGFMGNCPFHKGCVEGMVRSDAIAQRVGVDRSQLRGVDDDHMVWEITAHYLAQLCVTLTLLVSPQVIVLGGGVMKRAVLFPLIREKFAEMLNSYVTVPPLERYIVPSVHEAAGLVGALELSRRAAEGVN